MWTSMLDLRPQRTVPTLLLGRLWHGAYFAPFAPLQVQNTPRQSLPATTWVRVRNRLSGISGCDLRLISGESDLRTALAALPTRPQRYPGHEVIGEVIEVGNDAEYLSVGDRVVLQYGPNCITAGVQPLCRSCANGNYHLCERVDLPGPYPIGGGWSEEMLLHEQQLYPVPEELSDDQAVMLEPAAVALHAVLRHTPRSTDRILIIGAGTMGLLTLMVAHTLVPRAEISVLARHSFQIEQATRLEAAHIIYPRNSYAEMQQVTESRLYEGVLGNKMLMGGYDLIFDCIGSRKTLSDALRWTRANGAVVLVGQNPYMMNIDLTPIWHQELQLVGSLAHGTEIWPLGSNSRLSTFSVVALLMEQGLLQPERLITHRFALTEYRQALTTAMDKEQSRSLKVLFDYAKQPASVVPNVRASRPRRATISGRGPTTSIGRTPQSAGALPTAPFEPKTPEEPEPPIQPAPLEPEEHENYTVKHMFVSTFDYDTGEQEQQSVTNSGEPASLSSEENSATDPYQ